MIEQKDPNGMDAHKGGAKLDGGKPKICIFFDEYFPHAIEAVTEISAFGAIKYSPGGWKKVPDGYDRYTEAMRRHYAAVCKGEIFDDDSKLPHDYQIAWNALARLELGIKEGKYDMKLSEPDEISLKSYMENAQRDKDETFDSVMAKYKSKSHNAQDIESRKRDALTIPSENPDLGKAKDNDDA